MIGIEIIVLPIVNLMLNIGRRKEFELSFVRIFSIFASAICMIADA